MQADLITNLIIYSKCHMADSLIHRSYNDSHKSGLRPAALHCRIKPVKHGNHSMTAPSIVIPFISYHQPRSWRLGTFLLYVSNAFNKLHHSMFLMLFVAEQLCFSHLICLLWSITQLCLALVKTVDQIMVQTKLPGWECFQTVASF